jgi:hypothetical protein
LEPPRGVTKSRRVFFARVFVTAAAALFCSSTKAAITDSNRRRKHCRFDLTSALFAP